MSVIRLNVGGVTFDTTADTLRSRPGYLYDVAANTGNHGKDDTGRVFIDRDGVYFRYILEFLRYGALHPPGGFCDWSALRAEFMFYFGESFEDFYMMETEEVSPPPATSPPPPPAAPRTPIAASPPPPAQVSVPPAPVSRTHTPQASPPFCIHCGDQLKPIPPELRKYRKMEVSCDGGCNNRGTVDEMTQGGFKWCGTCDWGLCGGCSQGTRYRQAHHHHHQPPPQPQVVYPPAPSSPSLRQTALGNMKASEADACEGLLHFVTSQVDEYSSVGDGYIGVGNGGSIQLDTCKWAVWSGNWASLRSFMIIDSLMADGFDVILQGQVSIASLNQTFTCKVLHSGDVSVTPANPLKSVKGGFIVAWVRDAVKLCYHLNGTPYLSFASHDLRDFAYRLEGGVSRYPQRDTNMI